ncbi:hypothetical protein PGT21_022960 [Puccinia graminis f. sp. tritici]|uniref:HAT C-terminal dimerisation domain-containing protein n=1 Tax=Puccinia graminis f. sp. tritici TaxID=56615 RepID=A0A5B0QJB9_PUCGR|nr:hypothetical protein PGT21_022960 [Puccinia graminis f. sp. tritici]
MIVGSSQPCPLRRGRPNSHPAGLHAGGVDPAVIPPVFMQAGLTQRSSRRADHPVWPLPCMHAVPTRLSSRRKAPAAEPDTCLAQAINCFQDDRCATAALTSKLPFATLYQPAPEIDGIQAEICLYLKEDVETKDIEVLPYWASRQKSSPKLALMARRYLSIPATSAASERVFPTGHRVVSWQ